MRAPFRVVASPAAVGLMVLCAAALFAAEYFRPHAAVITVTNTNDSGPGSLRQAIVDVFDGGTIQFDPALNNLTIFLTSAELVIDKSITITGPGPNLLSVSRSQQAPNLRIFHLLPNHNVEISGLAIRNGQLQSENGAGILIDGPATVTINNCTISGNVVGGFFPATQAGGGGMPTPNSGGGGIYNNGTLSLVNSTVMSNSALWTQSYGGGGIHNQGTLTITQSNISGNSGDITGGGILNRGTLSISDSTVAGNHSTGFGHFGGDGGGIYNAGSLTVRNTIISGNQTAGGDISAGQGGGIYGGGTIIKSTIRNNSSGRGGGIYGFGTITNCTISDNLSMTGGGGGLYGGGTISNSTISGNTAGAGGGIFGGATITNSTINGNTANQGGGIYANAAVQLGHTILKAGSGANIVNNGGGVTSLGYNLSSDNGGGFLTGPGDQINTDPLLGPLQDNGGPTFTHELLMGSPAINAGDPNFTPPPFYDQRDFGYLRVYNNLIDIGSFEVQPLPTVSPTPTATATATIPIPTPTPTPCLAVLTQSTSQAITVGNSASCNDGVTHTDNSYWRVFDMTAHAGDSQYCIYYVSFGVEFANTTQPVTVRLYTTANFPAGFPGSLTQIASTTLNVGPAQNGTVVTTPLVVTVTSGTQQLVMELFTPNGQPGGYRFFVGSNPAVETGASYLSAPDCGITTPITTAALGFPNMHIVFDVIGDCTCSGPTPSITPTATITPPPTPTPTLTPSPTPCGGAVFFSENFDALPVGTPAECFYISNIDPDTPPNDLFTPDNDGITDCVYDFMNVQIPTATSVLRFRNNFDTEFSDGIYWDGGVLEVSSVNINGGEFLDVTDSHVGGSFVTGGYTGEIDGTANNPLAGRMAWSGNSNGYIDSIINLGPNLAGQTVTLRFRFGSDEAVGAPGWRIDTITIADGICPTPTPGVTPTSTPTATLTPGSTATPTSTPSVTPGPAQPLNLSTRMLVQTGDSVSIGGFIITPSLSRGSGPTEGKHVLLRAIGPSLSQFGVPNPLADPVLELHGPPGFETIINDNWADGSCGNICVPEFCLHPLESAICATLDPGAYTAIVRGNNNGSGVGLVEVYDLDSAPASKLANISTRAFVSTGADIMIAGFILGGNTGDDNVILRGIGPSLSSFGVPNALSNPTLELRDNNGALLRGNDNWQDDPAQAAIITAAGLALSDPLESGIAATLPPGQYTALLAGVNGGVGNGLVEAYDLGTSGPK